MSGPVLMCDARRTGGADGESCGLPAERYYALRDSDFPIVGRGVNPMCSCDAHKHTDPGNSGVWREVSYEEAVVMLVMLR